MFTYKTDADIQAMTEQEANAYAVAKRKHEQDETAKQIADAVKVSSDALQGELKTANKNLDELSLKFTQLEAKGKATKVHSFGDAFTEVKEGIISLVKGTSNSDVVIKATTNRASIADNPSGLFLPEIGQLGYKRRSLYDVLPKSPVANGNHQGLVRYVDFDEATTVKAAAVVAEGGVFPESTAKFKGFSRELVKIGDTLPVTEEFGTDEVAAAAELEMFLETNVKSAVDNQLINGPGTAGTIEGLVVASPAYTPVASGIVGANIYDLVKKVRTDIVFNRGSKYAPDIIVMNANTLDELQLTKDANQNYIFKDTLNIGSMIIIEDNNMADNVMVVGDRRYARIYEMFGVLISRGLKGDQFVEDLETIKARTRLLMLIRNVDKTGFRKVTSISAALTTLAS
jgi:HK97 family phage major capsid protein